MEGKEGDEVNKIRIRRKIVIIINEQMKGEVIFVWVAFLFRKKVRPFFRYEIEVCIVGKIFLATSWEKIVLTF